MTPTKVENKRHHSDDESMSDDIEAAPSSIDKRSAAGGVWLNRELELNKVRRSHQKAFRSIESAVRREAEACQAALLDFSGAEDLTHYVKELAVVQNRFTALKYILADGVEESKAEQALSDYIGKFKQADGAETASDLSADLGARDAARLATAPPCLGVCDLIILSKLRSVADMSSAPFRTKDELAEHTRQFLRCVCRGGQGWAMRACRSGATRV